MAQVRGFLGIIAPEYHAFSYQNNHCGPLLLGRRVLGELKAVDWSDSAELEQHLSYALRIHDERTPSAELEELKEQIRRHFPAEKYARKAATAYELLEPLQGSLAPYLDGRLTHITSAPEFLLDSDFCEWGYLLDFCSDHFHVCKGRQVKPLPEGSPNGIFLNLPNEGQPNLRGFYKCSSLVRYPLTDLPEEEQMLNDIEQAVRDSTRFADSIQS